MAETMRSALVPDAQPIVPWILVSALGHACGFGTWWGATALAGLLGALVPMCAHEPIVHDAIEVSVVSMPKSATNIPDRASRVARAEGTAAPNPDEPPPIETSDLKFKTPEVEPKTGNTDKSRQAALDALAREELLDELNDAPDGPEDRNQSDPNGTNDAALASLGVGSKGDPEFQRWSAQVQKILMDHFKPLGAVTEGHPNLKCMVKLTVSDDGTITGYEIAESSGILPFDQAAERAVQAVPSLPLPPEKYLPLLAGGVGFRFTPP
jgi:TonB family protein